MRIYALTKQSQLQDMENAPKEQKVIIISTADQSIYA